MKLPNKIIRYKESIISKFPIVLSVLESGSCSVVELFNAVEAHMDDVSDFIDVLDCLFALGKINGDKKTGRLSYAV